MRLSFSEFTRALLPSLMAAAVASAACSSTGGEPQAAFSSSPPPATAVPVVPVSTALVEQKSMPLSINVIGTAEAFSNVAVHAQITGELTSVTFKEGDDVQKGQVLFTLDRRPLEASLQQAEANLARDVAQANNARASAARYQDLMDRGIATKEQADQSRTSATALDATVAADRAAVESAKVQLQFATISAPLAGRTGALMVHEGNLVRANDTTPLVVINQIAPINVSFGIPEAQLPDLKRYMAQGSVRVEATPPSETAASVGRITFIDNAVDPTTGQIKIKGLFPNEDHRLWPGQFVNVAVTLKTDKDAVVVATTAVQSGQQGDYVFVVKPDKSVDLRVIKIARQAAVDTVVAEGLKAGELVVTDGQLRLVPGSKVSIKSGPGGPAAKVEP